jgi:hypothetical protein
MWDLKTLSKEDLIKQVQLTAELAVALDGLWFLAAEDALGFNRALDMDRDIWKRYAVTLVKRARKYYDLTGQGLETIKKIIAIDPLWQTMVLEYTEDTPNRLVFQVRGCPALQAMERMGRETYTCEPVETAYLTALAQALSPLARVVALKLPPRKSEDEICCSWAFSLEGTP